MPFELTLTLILAAVVVVVFIIVFAVCYKTCPPDKIMVIYGKVSQNPDGTYRSAKCMHGGAVFVIPFFQKYTYLDLTPRTLEINLKRVLAKQNTRVDFSGVFTFSISTEPAVMQIAAETLRAVDSDRISRIAETIIEGQIRQAIEPTSCEEINADRDTFMESVCRRIDEELNKAGLRLLNAKLNDVSPSR